MSAYTPPTYNVTPFNPAYFATSTGGLSLADASALFLKKTSADTASALETFTAGIATNSIDPVSSAAGAIVIGNLQTDSGATISIGNNASRTGNISIGQTTSIFSTTIGSSNASALVNLRNPILNYSYTTVPNYSSQTGETQFFVVNSLGGNAITLASDISIIATSASVGIGVYIISYSLRIAATSTTVPASVTSIKTYMTVANQAVTAAVPTFYGESSQYYSQTAPIYGTANTGLFPTISGSATVRILIAGTVTLRGTFNAGTPISLYNDGSGVRQPYNYLSYTRIA